MNKVADKRVSDSGRTIEYAQALARAIEQRFSLDTERVRTHTMKDTGPNWYFVSVHCPASTLTKIQLFADGFDAGTTAWMGTP